MMTKEEQTMMTKEEQTILNQIEELKKEKENLYKQLINIEVDNWCASHDYERKCLLKSDYFKEHKHLVGANDYYTKGLDVLVDKYGYEAINNRFVEMMEEEAKEDGESLSN